MPRRGCVPLPDNPSTQAKPLTIAFNSYDSQSGGRALMRLREILELPSSKRRPHDINTRDALIESLLNM